ncbi:MAG: hypothetical protein ABC537_03215 [Candidatus Methanosuratincola sp.]
MNKRIAILLVAALFIASVPIASTLATADADTYQGQQTDCGAYALQTQERGRLRDREFAMSNLTECCQNTVQERVQLNIQERAMLGPQAGICCNPNDECQSFTFQLREMLQAKNQNCIGYGK